jgi:hypothetical protein
MLAAPNHHHDYLPGNETPPVRPLSLRHRQLPCSVSCLSGDGIGRGPGGVRWGLAGPPVAGAVGQSLLLEGEMARDFVRPLVSRSGWFARCGGCPTAVTEKRLSRRRTNLLFGSSEPTPYARAMPVSRRLPKALQNGTRVSMIPSRARILSGPSLPQTIEIAAGFLNKDHAEQRRYMVTEGGEKVSKTF